MGTCFVLPRHLWPETSADFRKSLVGKLAGRNRASGVGLAPARHELFGAVPLVLLSAQVISATNVVSLRGAHP